MSLVLNKLVFGSQITCQSYIFVTIGFTRITDEVTNNKTRWQRPSWGTKISLNVCRDDFFSVAKFDVFFFTHVLPFEPCFAGGPSARPSFARYNNRCSMSITKHMHDRIPDFCKLQKHFNLGIPLWTFSLIENMLIGTRQVYVSVCIAE